MEFQTTAKIYLVDDDLMSLGIYEHHLRGKGYNDIRTFMDGHTCIDQLHEGPDLIFLDHNMTSISGLEVLRKIKRYDPEIFVVMVSGQDDMKTALNAMKFGAFDYIIKGEHELSMMDDVMERMFIIKEKMRRANPTLLMKLLSIF